MWNEDSNIIHGEVNDGKTAASGLATTSGGIRDDSFEMRSCSSSDTFIELKDITIIAALLACSSLRV